MRAGSTSLYHYLMEITGMSSFVIEKAKEHERVDGYIHYPSSTAMTLTKDLLTYITVSKEVLIREHLLPIQAHRDILMGIPKPLRKVVVLKRDAEQSFNSQLKRRSEPSPGVWSAECPHGSRGRYKTECRESFIKFREDIDTFFPEKDGFLHIEFDDLIQDSQAVASKILTSWGLDAQFPNWKTIKFLHFK